MAEQMTLMQKLKLEVERFRHKDFLKGMLAVCALTALADGRYNILEKYKIESILAESDVLSIYDPHKAVDILEDYVEAIRGDDRAKVRRVLDGKIRRLAGRQKQGRTLLRAAYLVIAADGVINDAERVEFDRICDLLALDREGFWASLNRLVEGDVVRPRAEA